MAKARDYFTAMQQAVAAMGEGLRLADFELQSARVAYMVIEQADGQVPRHTAAVCRFAFNQDEQGNQLVSVEAVIGEENNPGEASMSGRLLERLSPPVSEAAAAWRERCRGTLAVARQHFGPQPGDVITAQCHTGSGTQQAFYILQRNGQSAAYGLGLLDGRKYRLRFDEQYLTAALYGSNRAASTLHACYVISYPAGKLAADMAIRQEDSSPWETCSHAIKRRYRRRETVAFALRQPCQRFGLNWPLAVLAVGAPEAIAAQVTVHNQAIPLEQPGAIRRQDCWI